jgi:Gpi18-like mannosyltransferase
MRCIVGGWLRAHRYPLTVLVASRIGVYVLVAAAGWASRQPPSAGLSYSALFSPLGRWDASWYRWIALHGYNEAGAHGHHRNVVAFSPLYPLAYRVASALPGPMTLGGSLLSMLLFGSALCVLYDLGLSTVDRHTASRAVLYLAICPLSFVFSLPYSESLFLALVVGVFALAAAGRPWAAGVLAALAVLTRPIGIALVPALAWRAYRARSPGRAYLPLLLPIAAQVAFVAYLGIHTGDPLAPFHAQQHGWHRSISVLPVVFAQTLWHRVLLAPSFEAAVEVVFTLLWCGLFLHAWRMRLPGEYLIYAALAILIPTSAGSLLSIGRFGLVAFPLCWALAHLGRSPRIDTLVKATSPVLLATAIFLIYTTTSLTP